jgi:hypothetical protein
VAGLLFLSQSDNHRMRSVPRQVVQAGSTMLTNDTHHRLFG